jgi:hypothetical protein
LDEIGAIKAISEALTQLDGEERGRVLAWAQSRFGETKELTIAPTAQSGAVQKAPAGTSNSVDPTQVGSVKPPKKRSSKKTKTIISMDKNLDLSPQGKQSAAQFAAEKAPSNLLEKCVVAVYYLREVIELDKVSTQGVFTFFKTVQWKVPTDLRNTLQQTGSEGWLDTSDSDEIKLTSLGENRVEHDLPAKPKAKA